MQRTSVESSMIQSMGYDSSQELLEIEFASGAVWQYHDFPPDMWEEFQAADSLGRYFKDNIRDCFHEEQIRRTGRYRD